MTNCRVIDWSTTGRTESEMNRRKSIDLGKVPRKVPHPEDKEMPYRYLPPEE